MSGCHLPEATLHFVATARLQFAGHLRETLSTSNLLKLNTNSKILDDQIFIGLTNRSLGCRIILLSIGTVILFFILEIIREFIPENLVDLNGIQINSIGLLIIGLVVINSILIPKYLSSLKPKLSIMKIVGFTGLILFGIELVFKLIQNIIVLQNGLDFDFIRLLKQAGVISILSMLIANIQAHKLRKKGILVPILILITLWISIGLMINRSSG